MKKKTVFLMFIVLLLTFVLTGCSDDDGAGSNSQTGDITITVDPVNVSVQKGGAQSFLAKVVTQGDVSHNITWQIVGTGQSSGTSLFAVGHSAALQVAADETKTSLIIQVSPVDPKFEYKTVLLSVTITGTSLPPSTDPTVTNISVTPPSVLLMQGDTQDFSASVTGTNNPSQVVTWSVSGASSSDTKFNSPSGQSSTLTIGADETATSLTITATSTVAGFTHITGTASAAIPAAGSTISEVTVSPQTIEVQKGQTFTFTADVEGSGGHSSVITWTVEGSNTGSTISSAGVLSVAMTENASTLTVKAASTQDPTKFDTATVTVTAPAVPEITITAQPAPSTTVTAGSISGTLTVEATATHGATPVYQWFSNTTASTTGGTSIQNATSASFTIPVGLTANTYYYFCEVSAGLAVPVRSNLATVIVETASGPENILTPGIRYRIEGRENNTALAGVNVFLRDNAGSLQIGSIGDDDNVPGNIWMAMTVSTGPNTGKVALRNLKTGMYISSKGLVHEWNNNARCLPFEDNDDFYWVFNTTTGGNITSVKSGGGFLSYHRAGADNAPDRNMEVTWWNTNPSWGYNNWTFWPYTGPYTGP